MPGEHQPLRGKFALITGASRGIGRGIALRLAERGAAVAVNYRANREAAEEAIARIRQLGGTGWQSRPT